MAKTTIQDICDVAALKSLFPMQSTSTQEITPKSKVVDLQVDNNAIRKKTKKTKKIKDHKIITTPQAAVTRNIILGNVSLRRKWSDFLIGIRIEFIGFTHLYSQM